MAIASDLRATSDQRVRIDHRAVAHVSARVHEHRRHAHNVAADVAAVANARSAGHDAHAVARRKMPSPDRYPYRRTAASRNRWTYPRSMPMRKPTRIPFFTQALVRQPLGLRRVGLGRAHAARVQFFLECAEKLAILFRVARGLGVEQSFDLLFKLAQLRFATWTLSRSARDSSTARIFARFSDARRHQRQPEHGLEQSHLRHRRFHRRGIRFDEIHFQQRHAICAAWRALPRNLPPGTTAPAASFPREFRSTPRK